MYLWSAGKGRCPFRAEQEPVDEERYPQQLIDGVCIICAGLSATGKNPSRRRCDMNLSLVRLFHEYHSMCNMLVAYVCKRCITLLADAPVAELELVPVFASCSVPSNSKV